MCIRDRQYPYTRQQRRDQYQEAGTTVHPAGLGHRPGCPVKRQFFHLPGSGAPHGGKWHTGPDHQYRLRKFKNRGKAGHRILRFR